MNLHFAEANPSAFFFFTSYTSEQAARAAAKQNMIKAVSALANLPSSVQNKADAWEARQALYDYLNADESGKAAAYDKAIGQLKKSISAALDTEGLDKWTRQRLEGMLDNIDSGGEMGDNKADILAYNRERGRAYEKQKFADFRKKYKNTEQQITIRTVSGTTIRVDAIGLDSEGRVIIHEFKSSDTAPLTPNQIIAFPELYSNGGTVVGRGKGIFTGGYKIQAGTEVKIVRPE